MQIIMVVIQVLTLELYSEHGGTVEKLTNLPFKDRVSLFKQLSDFCLMIKYLGLSNEQIKKNNSCRSKPLWLKLTKTLAKVW